MAVSAEGFLIYLKTLIENDPDYKRTDEIHEAYVQTYCFIMNIYTSYKYSIFGIEQYYKCMDEWHQLNNIWADYAYAYTFHWDWSKILCVEVNTTMVVQIPGRKYPMSWYIRSDDGSCWSEEKDKCIEIPIGGMPVGTKIFLKDEVIEIRS